MSDAPKSGFLVDPESDPVLIRVLGRASFQNSAGLDEFITEMIQAGKRRVVIDFKECTSMDSTFLGVLAGGALRLRKLPTPGSLVLCRLSPRNLELVCFLGLNRILVIDPAGLNVNMDAQNCGICIDPAGNRSEVEQARHVLEAHENLVETDEANRARFQDVLTFLKEQVKEP